MAVIAAIAAMQIAGGMDYLVSLAERLLRRHPKYITFLAPCHWFMTILAGTGHTAFSTLPVITEVAKEQGIRPSRPLSIAGSLADCDYRLADFGGGGVLRRYP